LLLLLFLGLVVLARGLAAVVLLAQVEGIFIGLVNQLLNKLLSVEVPVSLF
jgi:hypothetical protein